MFLYALSANKVAESRPVLTFSKEKKHLERFVTLLVKNTPQHHLKTIFIARQRRRFLCNAENVSAGSSRGLEALRRHGNGWRGWGGERVCVAAGFLRTHRGIPAEHGALTSKKTTGLWNPVGCVSFVLPAFPCRPLLTESGSVCSLVPRPWSGGGLGFSLLG